MYSKQCTRIMWDIEMRCLRDDMLKYDAWSKNEGILWFKNTSVWYVFAYGWNLLDNRHVKGIIWLHIIVRFWDQDWAKNPPILRQNLNLFSHEIVQFHPFPLFLSTYFILYFSPFLILPSFKMESFSSSYWF